LTFLPLIREKTMLGKNNLIFDSIPALVGTWAAVYNYSALSINILGVDPAADTWIEVSNNPLCDPIKYAGTNKTVYGVPVTGNLGAAGSPPDVSEEADIRFALYGPGGPTDTTHGYMCMWSPSCLIWNYIRLVKTGTSSIETQAWLFGQVNT
jgi:hypothetical protein